MITILKSADISNVTRPFYIANKWTRNLAAEFFAQGDRERELGLNPSPIMDRTINQGKEAKLVLGFLHFVALPHFQAVADYMSQAQCLVTSLQKNKKLWEDIKKSYGG